MHTEINSAVQDELPPTPAAHTNIPSTRCILWDAMWGLGFVVLMLILKLGFETFAWETAEHLEDFTEAHLQRQLVGYDAGVPLSAVVVDLGSLLPVPDPNGEPVTPTEELIKVIETIVAARPSGIAIDIDFSSANGKPKHPDHPKFIEACLRISKTSGVPIFLGVNDAATSPEHDWLIGDENAVLAAGMEGSNRAFRMQYSFAVHGHKVLKGFGASLAEAHGESAPASVAWFGWALEVLEHRHVREEGVDIEIADYIPDFSPVQRLVDTTIHTLRPDALSDMREQLTKKMVFIGDAQHASDKFALHDLMMEPVGGVYLHACAALTPSNGYLWQLSHTGRLLMDLLLGASILLLVTVARIAARLSKKSCVIDHHFLNKVLTIFAIVLIWCIAMLFLNQLRLIWTDFPVLCASIALHGPFHHLASRCWKTIKKWFVTRLFAQPATH